MRHRACHVMQYLVGRMMMEVFVEPEKFTKEVTFFAWISGSSAVRVKQMVERRLSERSG